jgi:hypothetical protein
LITIFSPTSFGDVDVDDDLYDNCNEHNEVSVDPSELKFTQLSDACNIY